jgi:F-box and WD-40 domain protein 1/11
VFCFVPPGYPLTLFFLVIDIISQLPYELIYQILKELNVYSLLQLGGVNRRWREISSIGDEWHRRMEQHGWTVRLPPHWQEIITSSDQMHWQYWFLQRYRLSERWRLGQVAPHYLLGHMDSVYCVQFDDRKIISGSRDHTIKIWDAQSYQCARTLTGHQGSVLCLQYNQEYLVSGSSDSTVMVWCMRTLQRLMRIRVKNKIKRRIDLLGYSSSFV